MSTKDSLPTINVENGKIEGEPINEITDNLERAKLPPELKVQILKDLEQFELPKTGGGPGTSVVAYGAAYISCASLMYLAFSSMEKAAGGTNFQDFESAFFGNDCSRPRPSMWDRMQRSYTYDELRENPFCAKLTTSYFDAISRIVSILAPSGISPLEFYINVKQGNTFLYYTKIIFGSCTAGALAVGAYAMFSPVGGKSRKSRKTRKTRKTKKSRKQK